MSTHPFSGMAGSGKTFTANVISRSIPGLKSFFITGDEVFGAGIRGVTFKTKWILVEGESSSKLSQIFEEFKKAALQQPSLLVIDNFEAVGTG